MKKVTLIIRKNQNNVTASEIARIKRNIRKQFDGKLRFTTLANNAADSVIDSRTGYVNLRTQYIDVQNSYMVIETSDVNYKFTAEVCEVSSDLRNTNLSDFSVSWKY